MKKFNGHRCERRNLTDLVLGTGPDGKPRPKPKAKKRPKNFTTEPARNRKFTGGFTAPGLDYNVPQAPLSLEQLFAQVNAGQAAPGQVPGKLSELLGNQAKASAISAGGQAVGEFITGLDKRASDPGAKYGVGEGAGALIKGATNPLAMALGPVGMGVGAALGLAGSIFKHKKEKDEFELAQEEAREERIANEMAAAQSFSDQVLQTYSQEGIGGGLYARLGGAVDRFYTGGPTEPPAVMPGMEQYAQYANLNPELANAVANMPERNDRLTSFTDAELSRNEQMQRSRVDAASLEKAKDVAGNIVQYHMDKPLDALGMDLALLGQVPIIGEPADLLNAGISTTRAAYNKAVGDTAKAQEQAILASLSAASAIPFMGNVAGVSRVAKGADTVATGLNVGKAAHHVAHGAHDLERAVIAGKGVKAATYEGYEMGGPVDYETEKSEVILASPNDPPVAVGQGKYTQVSNNLYRAKGPSHKHGGIPTRGATQPFVDNTGTYNDSPYVFSDAKEMRFDPSEILSMIT